MFLSWALGTHASLVITQSNDSSVPKQADSVLNSANCYPKGQPVNIKLLLLLFIFTFITNSLEEVFNLL